MLLWGSTRGGQDGPRILEMVGCHWVLCLAAIFGAVAWCHDYHVQVPCWKVLVVGMFLCILEYNVLLDAMSGCCISVLKNKHILCYLGSMLKGFLSVMFLFFLAISVCSILWVSNAEHAQQNAQQNTSGHSPLTQRRNHVCRAIYKCRKSLGANEPKAWNRKSG